VRTGEIPAGFIALVVSPIGDSLVSGAGSRRCSQVVSGLLHLVTRTGLQASDPAKAPYVWSLSIADPRKLIKIAVSIANVAIQ